MLSLPGELRDDIVKLISPRKTFTSRTPKRLTLVDSLIAASISTRLSATHIDQPVPSSMGTHRPLPVGNALTLSKNEDTGTATGVNFLRMTGRLPPLPAQRHAKMVEDKESTISLARANQSSEPPVPSLSPFSASSLSTNLFGMSTGRQETSASQLPQRTA